MSFTRASHQAYECQTKDEVLALAETLQRAGSTDHEREFLEGKQHVNELKARIVNRLALSFHWCVALCAAAGIIRRVDGQHSSKIFLSLSEAEWEQVAFPILIYYEEWACDTEDDIALLFEQFNPKWSARTQEDLEGFHLALFPELNAAVSRHVACHLTSGMAWYFQEMTKLRYTNSDKYQLLHNVEHHPFLLFCGSFLRKGKTHELLRKGVIAAMFHSLRIDTVPVRNFWKDVAVGVALDNEESAEWKLAEFLDHMTDRNWEWRKSSRVRFTGNQQKPSDRDVFATCLHACDAFLKHTYVKEIFVQAKGRELKDICETHLPLSRLQQLAFHEHTPV
jgi:hypothetical protein